MPYFKSLTGGIPCVSRSPLSVKAKENVNCVQEKREATGEAFETVCATVDSHHPSEIQLECVDWVVVPAGVYLIRFALDLVPNMV